MKAGIRTMALVLAAGALGGCVAQGQPTASAPAAVSPAVASLPRDNNVLFWTQEQRDLAFRHFDELAPAHVVAAGRRVTPLPAGAAIAPHWQAEGGEWTIDRYMTEQRVAGLIVIQDGRVRLERYGLGFTPEQRWTSFSVAKSFTSTLVGAAI